MSIDSAPALGPRAVFKRRNQQGIGPKDQAKSLFNAGRSGAAGFMYASNYMGGAAHNYYSVEPLASFLHRYLHVLRPPQRLQYEMFLEGIPLKLCYDLEFSPLDFPDLSMDACIDTICEHTAAVLGHDFGLAPPTAIVRLDANRATKTSTHLIFSTVVFRDYRHLNEFVNGRLIPRLRKADTTGAEAIQVLDDGIYRKDGCFRIYGSQKSGGRATPLLPPGAVPADPLRRDLLLQSLATVIPVGGQDPLAYGRLGLAAPSEGNCAWARTRVRAGGPNQLRVTHPQQPPNALRVQITERFVRWLRERDFPSHPYDIRWSFPSEHRVDFAISPGLPCDVAKRVHKSNRTYFNYYIQSGEGAFQCTDPDCCRDPETHGRFGKGYYRDELGVSHV